MYLPANNFAWKATPLEPTPPVLPTIRLASYDGYLFNLYAGLGLDAEATPTYNVDVRKPDGWRQVAGLAIGSLHMLKELQGCDLGDDISVIFAVEQNRPTAETPVNWELHGDTLTVARFSDLSGIETWRDFVRQLPRQPEKDPAQPKWSIAIHFVEHSHVPSKSSA